MKYIVNIFILLLILCLPVFANNKQIPEAQKKQYQIEINQLINRQIPKTKYLINKLDISINNENNIYVKQVTIEQGINSILFDFYMDLVNITDKYTNIKQDLPATDYYIVLKDLVTPYLQENNINLKKINNLLKYAEKKQAQFEKNI